MKQLWNLQHTRPQESNECANCSIFIPTVVDYLLNCWRYNSMCLLWGSGWPLQNTQTFVICEAYTYKRQSEYCFPSWEYAFWKKEKKVQ